MVTGVPFGENVTTVELGFGSASFLREPFTFGDDCTCHTWYWPYGTAAENHAEQYVSFFVFAVTICNLLYYTMNAFRATAGWEEIYVCIIELFTAAVSAWPQLSNPYTLYLSTGQRVQFIRYFEWLMTCPVILIHLSNLTGLKHHYPLSTMMLIVSDIGCILCGVQCAFSNGYAKIIWFCASCLFCVVTFVTAWKVYKSAYAIVPDVASKRIVLTMSIVFFVSWSGYPILFALGPEGFQGISYYAMNIGYAIDDLFSKNLWGLLGHTLRLRAYRHSQDGWVLPRNVSGGSIMDSVRDDKGGPDQQQWVANMQGFTSDVMLMVAEIHKRVRNEDPTTTTTYAQEDTPVTSFKAPPSGARVRRRSMGDMVADDIIRCAQGRQSIGGDVDAEMTRKSQEVLHMLLGEDYDRVVEVMESTGGMPTVMASGNISGRSRRDSANFIEEALRPGGSGAHAVTIPPQVTEASRSQGGSGRVWTSGRLDHTVSGQVADASHSVGSQGWVADSRQERPTSPRTGPGSGKVAPTPLPRTTSTDPLLSRTVTTEPMLSRTVTTEPMLPRTVSTDPLLSRTVTTEPLARTLSPVPPPSTSMELVAISSVVSIESPR